jgi:hypothetical protein
MPVKSVDQKVIHTVDNLWEARDPPEITRNVGGVVCGKLSPEKGN